MGPVSWGIAYTNFPSGETWFQVQGTNKDFVSPAPYFERSTNPSVTIKEGKNM